MGLPNFLQFILDEAGQPMDLRAYSIKPASDSNNTDGHTTSTNGADDTQKTLRIAVDASSFIYKASVFHGEKLADPRHLSDYGRSQMLYEQQQQQQQLQQGVTGVNTNRARIVEEFINHCCTDIIQKLKAMLDYAEILVVLDGRTPPVKLKTTEKRREKRATEEQERDRGVDDNDNDDDIKRRIRANRRAGAGNEHYGALVDAVIDSLREKQIPFLVAPYEADGQLAFLQQESFVDLIVTEDSDLIAYMCPSEVPIFYKLGAPAYCETTNSSDTLSTMSQGILLGPDQLNGATKNVLDKDAPKRNLQDFSAAMMACVFAASGCDYCPSLRGIGNITAIQLARVAFLGDPIPISNQDSDSDDSDDDDDDDEDDNNIDDDNSEGGDENTPLGRFIALLFGKTWDRRILTDTMKEEFQRNFLDAVYMFRHNLVYNPLTGQCRPLRIRPDRELVSFQPYRSLCHGDDEQAQMRRSAIVGERIPAPLVTYVAEGWLDPRTLQPREIYRRSPNKLPDYVMEALSTHHGSELHI